MLRLGVLRVFCAGLCVFSCWPFCHGALKLCILSLNISSIYINHSAVLNYTMNFNVADCTAVANPVNGHVQVTGSGLDSVATFECNEGYSLVGSSTLVCTDELVWNGNLPVCKKSNIYFF